MLAKLKSWTRTGLIALGMIGGLSISAGAAPAGLAASPTADGAGNVINIQGDGRYSDCIRSGSCMGGRGGPFLNDRGRSWSGGNRQWRGNRHWNGNRHWRHGRNDWPRRYNRRHYRPYYGGSGIYFGFGVPDYGYYEPRRYYQPRRIYRSGGGSHVQWCYNRYRSYRAWDNTYQPYNGRRRQCWSPYR